MLSFFHKILSVSERKSSKYGTSFKYIALLSFFSLLENTVSTRSPDSTSFENWRPQFQISRVTGMTSSQVVLAVIWQDQQQQQQQQPLHFHLRQQQKFLPMPWEQRHALRRQALTTVHPFPVAASVLETLVWHWDLLPAQLLDWLLLLRDCRHPHLRRPAHRQDRPSCRGN